MKLEKFFIKLHVDSLKFNVSIFIDVALIQSK